jgi:hypothetical protein
MRIFVLPGANIVQRVGFRDLQLTVSCSLQPEPSPLTDLLLAIGYWLLAILYRLCASPNTSNMAVTSLLASGIVPSLLRFFH